MLILGDAPWVDVSGGETLPERVSESRELG